MGTYSEDMDREAVEGREDSQDLTITRYVIAKHLSTSNVDELTVSEVEAAVKEFVELNPMYVTSTVVNDVINMINRGGFYQVKE